MKEPKSMRTTPGTAFGLTMTAAALVLLIFFGRTATSYAAPPAPVETAEAVSPAEPDLQGAREEVEGDIAEFEEFDEFDEFDALDQLDAGEKLKPIPDPLEPFNRAMFVFNDRMYFWVLKPAAQGYNRVVPEKGRVAIKRFFTNLMTPVRLVNSVLQIKYDRAGTELARFCINTTVGVLGFMDPARDRWGIYLHDEDFGQTLGFYGSGPGFFITWPFLGPSSARDTVGMVGDFFLKPTSYLFAEHPHTGLSVTAYDKVNSTSLSLGIYEDLKKDALDPYSFIRDAYHQHREHHVKE